MKLKLDFNTNVVTVEGYYTLGEIIEKLKKLNLNWEDWHMKTEVFTLWPNPIIINEPWVNPYPWNQYPNYDPCVPFYSQVTGVNNTTSRNDGNVQSSYYIEMK